MLAADHLSEHAGALEQSSQSRTCRLSQAVWSQPQAPSVSRMFFFLFVGKFEVVVERCSGCGTNCGKIFSLPGEQQPRPRGRDQIPAPPLDVPCLLPLHRIDLSFTPRTKPASVFKCLIKSSMGPKYLLHSWLSTARAVLPLPSSALQPLGAACVVN